MGRCTTYLNVFWQIFWESCDKSFDSQIIQIDFSLPVFQLLELILNPDVKVILTETTLKTVLLPEALYTAVPQAFPFPPIKTMTKYMYHLVKHAFFLAGARFFQEQGMAGKWRDEWDFQNFVEGLFVIISSFWSRQLLWNFYKYIKLWCR